MYVCTPHREIGCIGRTGGKTLLAETSLRGIVLFKKLISLFCHRRRIITSHGQLTARNPLRVHVSSVCTTP